MGCTSSNVSSEHITQVLSVFSLPLFLYSTELMERFNAMTHIEVLSYCKRPASTRRHAIGN